jgi:hypothetical protein
MGAAKLFDDLHERGAELIALHGTDTVNVQQ